jgi:hypothetical protein
MGGLGLQKEIDDLFMEGNKVALRSTPGGRSGPGNHVPSGPLIFISRKASISGRPS